MDYKMANATIKGHQAAITRLIEDEIIGEDEVDMGRPQLFLNNGVEKMLIARDFLRAEQRQRLRGEDV